jgi:hypothetical protein
VPAFDDGELPLLQERLDEIGFATIDDLVDQEYDPDLARTQGLSEAEAKARMRKHARTAAGQGAAWQAQEQEGGLGGLRLAASRMRAVAARRGSGAVGGLTAVR